MRVIVAAAACVLAACGPAPQAAPEASSVESAASGWDARLTEMLPYIDACIAFAPDTRWVSYAGQHGDGQVLVRLLGDGGGYDCTAPDGAPAATRSTPRVETLEVDGERSAIFVRGPGENPGGECYDAEEVRSNAGELLGWWADPEGC